MNLAETKKYIQTLTSWKYGDRLRPVRDWFIILAVVGAIFLISIIWNSWLFLSVIGGDTIGSASPPPPSLSTGSVESVYEVFEARAEEAQKYRTEYRFVDPSRSGG